MQAKEANTNPLPRHLAIIMDGNRRWAQKKLLKRNLGHLEGAKNLKQIISECSKLGVGYVTVYAFSTENWKRSKEEVGELLKLLSRFLNDEIDQITKQDIKVNIIGDVEKFPDDIKSRIRDVVDKTKDFKGLNFNIALSYGSREEIVMAMKNVAEDYSKGILSEIDESVIQQYLYTKDIPDPDLIIRTSGEYRLSNFLLWQAAYAEFYFSDKLWPEFDKKELHLALRDYANRDRRFGTG